MTAPGSDDPFLDEEPPEGPSVRREDLGRSRRPPRRESVAPVYGTSKETLLRELGKLWPPTITLMVNGRPLPLEQAINLIDRLPLESQFGRRGIHLFIQPDPFAASSDQVRQGEQSAELAAMVKRLTERQDATDHLYQQEQEEQRRRRWWRRLLGRLKAPR